MLDKDTLLKGARLANLFNQKLNLMCKAYRNFREERNPNFYAMETLKLYGMISGIQVGSNDIPAEFFSELINSNDELSFLCDEGWVVIPHDGNNVQVLGCILSDTDSYISERLDKFDSMAQEVEDYKATVDVMSDKELYDTIKNTDENTELYDEDELDW